MAAKIYRGGLSRKSVEAAVEALANGGLIIYPTDTIYGIGCDMKNPKALEKLNTLKKRPKTKPFSFICNDVKEASMYAAITDSAYRVMKKVLPGPYTFILPIVNDIPRKMVNADHAVGIRIPDHPVPLEIVRAFGGPITTTSVNISTEEPVNAVGDLSPEFTAAVDVIIDDGPVENIPSTIIDFTENVPRILRRGKGLEELKPHIDFVLE